MLHTIQNEYLTVTANDIRPYDKERIIPSYVWAAISRPQK